MAKITVLIIAVLFAGALAKGHSSHDKHSSHNTHARHGKGRGSDLSALKAIAVMPRIERAQKLEKGTQSAAVSPINGKSMEEDAGGGLFALMSGEAAAEVLEERCSKLALYLSSISNPPPTNVIDGIRLAKCAQAINKVCSPLEKANGAIIHWALDQAWQCAAGVATHAIHHAFGLSAIAGAVGECTKGVIDNWLDGGVAVLQSSIHFMEEGQTGAVRTKCEEYETEDSSRILPYRLIDITHPPGLMELNVFMEHRTYFDGEQPCVLDAQMEFGFGERAGDPIDYGTYPYVYRYLQTLQEDKASGKLAKYASIPFQRYDSLF